MQHRKPFLRRLNLILQLQGIHLPEMILKGKDDMKVGNNCEVIEKTNKMQQLDVYYQYFLNMFRASLCPSSGDQDVCYCTWCAALVLLVVVGSGCGALCCRVRAL